MGTRKSTLTFEVWTVKADGTPDTKVKLTDDNPYGVKVSPYSMLSGSLSKLGSQMSGAMVE
ncbi:hypothetical protein ABZY10_29150 [Streptomyces sp. NPDC006539]|uniref:hypothetical protein n=1 Tax=Streptomyces sp. NPDC006539 TaxID=3155352 RepID=UPI00339E24CE